MMIVSVVAGWLRVNSCTVITDSKSTDNRSSNSPGGLIDASMDSVSVILWELLTVLALS